MGLQGPTALRRHQVSNGRNEEREVKEKDPRSLLCVWLFKKAIHNNHDNPFVASQMV